VIPIAINSPSMPVEVPPAAGKGTGKITTAGPPKKRHRPHHTVWNAKSKVADKKKAAREATKHDCSTTGGGWTERPPKHGSIGCKGGIVLWRPRRKARSYAKQRPTISKKVTFVSRTGSSHLVRRIGTMCIPGADWGSKRNTRDARKPCSASRYDTEGAGSRMWGRRLKNQVMK